MRFLLLIILLLFSSLAFSKEQKLSIMLVNDYTLSDSYYSELETGLNKFQFESDVYVKHNDPILLIVGINETGGNWKKAIETLFRQNTRDVYIFKWDKRKSYKETSREIANSINFLQKEYQFFYSIIVFAHSAGGVLLLNSLREDKNKEKYPFELLHENIKFYTAATPFSGYHHRLAFITKPIIGSVAAFVGSTIKYGSINKNIDFQIFTTRFENDETIVYNKKYDIRLPVFKKNHNEHNFNYYELKTSTHTSSIVDALEIIMQNN